MPLLVRSFRNGAPEVETRILKVEKKPVDAALFEVPAGYTKRSITGPEPSGASGAAPAE